MAVTSRNGSGSWGPFSGPGAASIKAPECTQVGRLCDNTLADPVFGLTLGQEDLVGPDALRADPMMALLAGKRVA